MSYCRAANDVSRWGDRSRTCGHVRRLARCLIAVLASLTVWVSAGNAADQSIRLTMDGTMKFTPAFFKGGSEIAFVQFVKPTMFQIMCLRMDDRTTRPLHEDETDHELDVSVSRDGAYYAYVKCHGTLKGSSEIRDANQKEVGHVAAGEGFAVYRSLAFAPDNSRLLFSYAENVHQQLFSVDLKGDDLQPLTDSTGINNWPSFSPDGTQIVFGSTRDGNYEIYKMQADGSTIRRLTNSPTMDLRPRFSPDGRLVSFTSNRDGNYEVYVMSEDGANPRRVTNHPERDDYAMWHPDGKQLLMVSERSGNHDLYLVELPP